MDASAGHLHTVALDVEGRLWAWGDLVFGNRGGWGLLENGRRTKANIPTLVDDRSDWLAMDAGYYRIVAVYGAGETGKGIKQEPAASVFSDLDEGHWAFDNIMEMVELGILSGYPDGTFKPNNTISRAEFAKIMVLALKLQAARPATPTFADVDPNHWAYEVVESARDYLTGYRDSAGSLTFEPTGVAVREDVAVAIVKAKGFGNAPANLGLLEQFPDQGQISQALRDHVAIAVEKGYMQGSDIGFEPQKALTRAEACALLSRLIDRIQFQEEKEKITF